MENVQKMAVNMVVGLKSSTYEDKLKELNLPSLQERMRGDMVQVWKYLHEEESNKIFKMADQQHSRYSTHTNRPWKMYRLHAKLEVRKNFFTSRSVDRWNSLPHGVQSAADLNSFKNNYDVLRK